MTSALGRLPALAVLCLGWLLAGCDSAPPPAPSNTPRPVLAYLGQAQLAFGATFADTVVGGLSAISYDAGRQLYYVISDDRSEKSPARFYTAQLSLSDKGINRAAITGIHPFLDQSGQPFRPLMLSTTPPVVPPDPEGIAFDPIRQRLYWSSEGERLPEGPVLLDPWIRTAALDGGYLGQFTLPPNLAVSAQQTGPRSNRALEGVTLTPDGQSLFAAMEEPGYNDGPETGDGHRVLTRFTKFDVATGTPTAQYAYPMDAPTPPVDENGVSDLVALSDTAFLVLERTIAVPPEIRVYRVEIGSATNVLNMPSIIGVAVTPMAKSLAVDMNTMPGLSPLGNIEGITLGPKLADGRQSVVLVSDNDFSPRKVTAFLLFAM
ncbi:esterase-like activity of phytase family protein [Mycobacterium montefiorense]|uniref:Phytase n=1 Tax=Mycobacterium montefiorense TaxID=154654 RepID=A0AA37UWU3_9MYCO|nr:esterase-like activity of phytase family protein [Mycobacterium montefiorense]GBG40108.1 phytase [Mycobacterium montefiorense]GKU36678.1 phytase [Mycobacterium montefiorense]GKU38043.1 phytase [Mycobacterium montefiorense]GKU47295.1 phytase [Mycobacterium montefiorense]GKU50442.1 phytase [Mycobacterium montefiorense]